MLGGSELLRNVALDRPVKLGRVVPREHLADGPLRATVPVG